ncbi:hypothetical protein FDP41_000910 [Naegleria fowleri]|uniref:Uncharacterized protein n=1 Tax=Naegleria fowleri TaxID=5763 RepID=A0A6A5BRF7_NAEFO|nr:uncharacterized protein FDP41_000910 [Naegleria fowleri]KAF0979757.1 hypothetical protein FDP41_000910 [Naegleria fowleri]
MQRNPSNHNHTATSHSTTTTPPPSVPSQQLYLFTESATVFKQQPPPSRHEQIMTELNALAPGEASASSPASLVHIETIPQQVQPQRDDKGNVLTSLTHHQQQQEGAASVNFMEASPSHIQYSSPFASNENYKSEHISQQMSPSTMPLVGGKYPQFYGDRSDQRIDSLQLVPFEATLHEDLEDVDIHTTEEDTSTLQSLRRRSFLLARPSKHLKFYFGLAIVVAVLGWMVPCLSLLPLIAFYGYFKNSHNPRERKYARSSKKAIYFLILFDIVMFIVLFVSVTIYVLARERAKPNFN